MLSLFVSFINKHLFNDAEIAEPAPIEWVFSEMHREWIHVDDLIPAGFVEGVKPGTWAEKFEVRNSLIVVYDDQLIY